MRLEHASFLIMVFLGWVYTAYSTPGATSSRRTTQCVDQFGFMSTNNYHNDLFHGVLSDTSFRLVDTLDLPATYEVEPGQLSKDGLQYYLSLDGNLYVLKRQTVGSGFGPPELLPGVINNSSVANIEPTVTADGKTIVFVRNSDGYWTGNDLYIATRPDTSSPFDFVRSLSEINQPDSGEGYPWISPDGLALYYTKLLTLAVTRRNSISEPFGTPQQMRIGSPSPFAAWLTNDQKQMYFSQQAPTQCIYSASRPSPDDTFHTPLQHSEFSGFWFVAGPSMIGDQFYIYHLSPQQSRMILIFRHDTTTLAVGENRWNGPLSMDVRNYPNPFNPATTIEYDLPNEAFISLGVYDIKGKLVTQLAEGRQTAGRHTVDWNASTFASGLYFCRLHTATHTWIRKLLLLK